MFNHYVNTKAEFTGIDISIHLSQHINIVLESVFFTRHKMLFVSEKHKFHVKQSRKNFILQIFFLKSLCFYRQRIQKILNKMSEKKEVYTTQKISFLIKDFFCKCDQILSFLRFSSYLLKKPLIENFIVCSVIASWGIIATLTSIYTSPHTAISQIILKCYPPILQ